MFEPFVENLPKDWTIAIARYPDNIALGYEQLKDEAKKAIPPAGSYFVLGESFSGPLAVSLAESADSRLKGVIFCCSFMKSPIPALSYLGKVIRNYPMSGVPFFLIEKALLGSFRSPTLSKLLRSSIRSVSNAAFTERLRAIQSVDVSAKLANLSIPIIYLRATKDCLVNWRETEAMQQTAKHMVVIGVKGPHCLLQASPREAAREVILFVEQQERIA